MKSTDLLERALAPTNDSSEEKVLAAFLKCVLKDHQHEPLMERLIALRSSASQMEEFSRLVKEHAEDDLVGENG